MESIVKESLALLRELRIRPEYYALQPSQTSRIEWEIATGIQAALCGGGISVNGTWNIQQAQSLLRGGAAAQLRPAFQDNLRQALLPLLQRVRFYPVDGEWSEAREETARKLASVLEGAL